ncbi:CRISPR-associated protein Cas4 [Litorilinea aerophila]|uniref:CRISPR-associated exonuclease Cas4 n=1 Tax=Litorilinea aerophila TaxID=1204385 RepID=A0A540VD15_9CHLR|nr:CRISPR-associated protein Cas4 [Litorilinea aerophila]MCC9077507.1 CRISPR-associated protein Cas4 [Litorilinea aerophila]GIV79346.1 MAG: CRISPR-associated protein Cas4 [Litorilinea sp.]
MASKQLLTGAYGGAPAEGTADPRGALPSWEDPWLLEVTDLKQFDYCPRVVYYRYCLSDVRPVTYKMAAGIEAQSRVTRLEDRRSLRAYGLEQGERHYHVSVVSTRLGCSGQIDMVIVTGSGNERRAIPVDFKLSRRKPGNHFRLQLVCYGLMLEEAWGIPATEGYIYLIPSRQAISVPFTAHLRRKATRLVTEIREMIMEQRMPGPPRSVRQCVDCEFRRFCNDTI